MNPLSVRRGGLAVGAAAFCVTLVGLPPAGLSLAAWHTAGIAVLMSVWWATEATDIAVTSLLPIVLFPVLGIAEIEVATRPYGGALVFLFLGGFLIALAMERCGLHRRLALAVIQRAGAGPQRLVLGFMLATGLVSMWISNSATTMMMLPIATSVAGLLLGDAGVVGSERDRRHFASCLMLGVAYAASIGGVGTLIGTATNVVMANLLRGAPFFVEVGFAQWMLVGVPFVVVMLPLSWWVLTRIAYPFALQDAGAGAAQVRRARAELGPVTAAEQRVALVAVLVALAWVLRGFFKDAVPGASDAGIAMTGALALFLLPAGGAARGTLMDWQGASKLPWGIAMLLGGGLALADAMGTSGLAAWISAQLAGFGSWPLWMLLALIVSVIIAVTELTTNAAVVSAFGPVVGALAVGLGMNPVWLVAPVGIAASCAFMLPVSTPPNAIVFGTGYVTVPQLMRAGLWLNLIAVPLVTLLGLFWVPRVFP